MYGTKPFTRTQINATKAPLDHDGDCREIWVGDRKIAITRITDSEYRIVVLTCFGSTVDGYTRTEATEAAIRKLAQGYFLEFTGYEAPFVIEDDEQAKPFATPAQVIEAAEQITAAAAPSTTEAPALKATHQGVTVRDDRLSPAQQRAVNAATDGIIHRGATASIATLKALHKAGHGELIYGSYNDPTRTNQIIGLALTQR